MAYTIPIYGGWLDNILLDATITGTAPSTSYALATLNNGNPGQRVRWGATTVTVTFTLGSSKLGEVITIPMHNITPGSTTVAVLTNAAGLSVNLPVPALQSDGFPPTLAYDFSASTNKTSNAWTLTITSNSANVILGGAIAIYPKKTFTGLSLNGTIRFEVKDGETRNKVEATNEYASIYVQDYGTVSGDKEIVAVGTNAAIVGFLSWYRTNYGGVRPGLLWVDPSDANGGLYGRWPDRYEQNAVTSKHKTVSILYRIWPKGEKIS